MEASHLSEIYDNHPCSEELIRKLSESVTGRICLKGLSGSSKAMVVASVYRRMQMTSLVIIPEKEDAAYFYNDLVSLLGEKSVYFFPSTYKRSAIYEQTDPAGVVLRTSVLNFLSSGSKKGIIVTFAEAMMEKVAGRETLSKNTFTIKKGDRLSLEFIEELLQEYRFERVDFVSEPGQYAIRGSIADVFSFSAGMPYRIDFFSEEVESIRTFSPDDQLSISVHDEVSVIPELSALSENEVGHAFPELLPPDSLVWTEDISLTNGKINNIYDQAIRKSNTETFKSVKNTLITGERLTEEIGKFINIEMGFSAPADNVPVISFRTEPQPLFSKNFELLSIQLVDNNENGYETIIVSESQPQIERLNDIFTEISPDIKFTPVLSSLHGGFTDHDLRIAIYTDHQIFDRYHKFKIRGYFTRKESVTIRELASLNPGDYVVHVDHGIGRFGGLEKIEVNGKLQEAIKLVYRDNDILYVPIHSLHRISKYRSSDGQEPRINKLGSGAWQRLKENAKKKVKDIAKDLIKLYATRMASQGYAFSADSYLQRELEASFLYEDTPDQLSATIDVKNDMESPHPMDRLVCGDVGFGKTEIAIRAAFKAAEDSKQTALLVPTTVLAYQHYSTFTERLHNFPCNIEYLTRHKKASEQKRILEKLEKGQIDIIIGTHKLISDDIKFRDLGLLIIDEEQRFGVAAKEKLKKLKTSVDTLTLTATPIPRTLQFSLMGARDLSIINTPPPNRMPIITELHVFNEEIIKEGIEYEVSRNGQVFIIHNRIETINNIQQLVKRLCPEVKSAIVHGKMYGRTIEKTMLDFIRGDYDVLIATTIIESGLDIPNANTIFINEAHHFGLSELHQLRGRVGRSNRKAFCYLLAPPLELLPAEAKRRLKAIEEFSELGSGFSIALQDIDIRGSGNLLGNEQSGFIAEMGIETYQRILNEAIAEIRESEGIPGYEEKITSPAREKTASYAEDCQIDTDFEIMFPDEYISNISERLRLYKELNEINSEEELAKFEQKLVDRFGPLPLPAKSLLEIVRIKRAAMKLGIEKIILKNNSLIAHFISDPGAPFYRSELFTAIISRINNYPQRMRMKQKDFKLTLTIADVKTVAEAMHVFKQLS
ncbi:MAG: transcription-repair coupling factor [Bacteroidales bacterium]